MKTIIYTKLFFAFFIVCSVTSTAFAQQYNVQIGPPVEPSPETKIERYGNSYYESKVFDNKMQFAFTFKLFKVKFGISLNKYDQSFKLVKEQKLSDGERAYGPFQPLLKKINGKLYLIYYQLMEESDNGNLRVMAAEIDTLKTALLPAKEILLVKQKNTGFLKTVLSTGDYSIQIKPSPDSSKAIVVWCPGIDKFYFYSVLDNNLNILHTKSGDVPESKKLSLNSCLLTNDEVVYIGMQNRQKAANYTGYIIVGRPNQEDKIITVGDNTNAYQVELLPQPKSNNIQVLGSFVAGDGVLAGMYSCLLDGSSDKLTNIKIMPFTDEFLKDLDKNDWATTKGKNRGISYTTFIPVRLDDGTTYLFTEMYKVESGEKYNYYYHGDIIGAYFNNDSTVFLRLPKLRRSSFYSVGTSFQVVKNSSKVIIFYNDKEENLLKKATEKLSQSNNHKELVLIAATISDGIVIKKEKIIDLHDDEYVSLVDWIDTASLNTLIIPLQKLKNIGAPDKKMRWGKVTISNF